MRHCGAGCWRREAGVCNGDGKNIGNGVSVKPVLESWCRWMVPIMTGLKAVEAGRC